MLDLNSAKNQLSAALKAVHVDSMSDAKRHRARIMK
jgi:hypothetical protein